MPKPKIIEQHKDEWRYYPKWAMEKPITEVTIPEFRDLLEYSSSLPTGTVEGKKWKRDLNTFNALTPLAAKVWVLCEYYLDDTIPKGQMGIRTTRLRLV
jgi:hypothetical protein